MADPITLAAYAAVATAATGTYTAIDNSRQAKKRAKLAQAAQATAEKERKTEIAKSINAQQRASDSKLAIGRGISQRSRARRGGYRSLFSETIGG